MTLTNDMDPVWMWGIMGFLVLFGLLFCWSAIDAFSGLRDYAIAGACIGLLGVAVFGFGFGRQVILDPQAQRVTDRRSVLDVKIAQSQWPFAAFDRVVVERRVERSASRRRGRQVTYVLTLQGPSGVKVNALPFTVEGDFFSQAALVTRVETLALQVAELGGWPVQRQGYRWDPAGKAPGLVIVAETSVIRPGEALGAVAW